MIMNTLRLWAILMACALSAASARAVDVLPHLKTKSEVYDNVSLLDKTATHLFIRHARGVANVKIAEVDNDALRAFGLAPKEEPKPEKKLSARALAAAARTGDVNKLTSALPAAWQQRLPANLAFPPLEKQAVLAILGGLFLAYLLFSYCSMLICQKTGNNAGLLVWLPVLNAFPMLRAAGMSGWWFLALCIPLVNLVAGVVWAFNISAARGKGAITAILLLLPVTGLFALLYLAFSGGSNQRSEEMPRRIRLEPLPV
jgi:hypothetical protein